MRRSPCSPQGQPHGRRQSAYPCSERPIPPAARYWSLTLYDPEGRLVANAIDRHGFTSEEIVRDADGRFAITVAALARPGNWLPTGGIEKFTLVWRLYDTPIGVATRTTKEGPMPTIVRKGCS